MDVLKIVGGSPLCGTVRLSGAKNAALPIMAAALLADGPVRLSRVPDVADVATLKQVLVELGMSLTSGRRNEIHLQNADAARHRASHRHVRRMRASFCVLGPLLAKRGQAIVPLPGGCSIGPRPVDLHLRGLAALGAEIRTLRGYVMARARRLRGAEVDLSGPRGSTVTGTANVLCAATLARGQTILRGAAREPEIVDLGNFLQRLGARISGLGTSIVEVHGVEQLGAAEHELIPDRIEAGTLLAAAAATGGRAVLAGAVSAHLTRVLEVLSDAGASINTTGDSITLSSSHPLRCIRLVAAPYPDFPTDLQAPFTVLACLARGTSIIADHVFPDRFAHVAQLRRMGARIVVERKGNTTRSRIADASRLHGASVRAGDLRASAALVVAALAAQGETHIRGLQHLDRGYDDLAGKLRGWGAHLNRVDHDPPGFTLLRLHSKLAV